MDAPGGKDRGVADGAGEAPDPDAAGGADLGVADGTEADPDTGEADGPVRGAGAGLGESDEATSGFTGVPYTCPPFPARG